MNVGSLIGYLGLDVRDWERGLNEAEGGLGEFAKKGAIAAAAAGVAIAGAMTAAVVGAMNVEAANDKLAAQLGLSAAESERVGGVAGALYAGAYGESLEDVNGAVAAVMSSIGGMNSASSADLQAITANAMDFATAMEVDVAGAATSAGLLVQTGLADNAQNAFDLLTVAAQEAGPAMVEPLMEASNEYATNFAAMGYSGEQAMALLVDASAGGEIALDKVGDSVKEFSIRATDMSTASVDAYKTLGMSADEMSNRILAGGDSAQTATQEIISGLLDIKDPATQANTAIALFGTPLEDLGVTKIPAFLSSMQMAGGELENVSGAAARMGATLNDNASANLESFKRQAIGAFVDILGGRVLPIVNSVASTLATQFGPALATVGAYISGTLVPALQSAAQWISANRTPILIVAGLIAAVFIPHLIALGVTSTATAIKTAAGWVMTQAGAVAAAAVHSFTVIKMVAGWVLMGAQAMLQAARMAAAWLIAMGPIGWVIAAVIGIVALIIANWDTIVKWTKQAWSAVSGAVGAAWDWIKGAVSKALDFVKNLFLNFTGPGLIIKHWDTIKSATSNAWAAVVQFVANAWQNLKSAVSNGVSSVVSFMSGLPGKILGAIGNLGSILVNAGKSVIEGFLRGITSAFTTVKNTLSNLTDMLPDWKGPAQRDAMILHDAGRLVMNGFENGLVSKFGDIQNTLGTFTSSLAAVPDDDSVFGNSFHDPNRGRAGYKQAEDGSWVPGVGYSAPAGQSMAGMRLSGTLRIDGNGLAHIIDARVEDVLTYAGTAAN